MFPEDQNVPGQAPVSPSDEKPDKAALELSREIFHLMSHAVTSLKLFPPTHATVVKFIDELYAKLKAYFDILEELEVDVQEDSFLIGEEVVFKEEHLAKSLPYLFHKDGMQKLTLIKGIDKYELRAFLDVIRKTALLPVDESDFVTAIWEGDFPHIRVYAPDDYLLAKIDIFTRQPFDFFVDRQKLYGGQIELTADDLSDVQEKKIGLGLLEEENKDYAELISTLMDEERDLIEFIIAKTRESPPEIEFHDTIFELLSLEERDERLVTILGFLERHHRELVQEGKFSHAVHLVRQISELKDSYVETNPDKAARLDQFLSEIHGGRTFDLLRESIDRMNFDSLSALFEYLGFLGTRAIPLVAGLLDEAQEPGTRRAALDYLEEISRGNIDLLAHLLQDQKPAITREIISLLGREQSKKALSYLAMLSTYTNKDVKLAAVEALASSTASLAQKILFSFAQDQDEDIGTAAADSLQWPGDEALLKKTIKLISSRTFRGFGPKRKISILNFLVRTGAPEALNAVRKVMAKPCLFARSRSQVDRLCAVEALARAGTPEARAILEQGLKSSNKAVSEACRKALERASFKGP